MSEQQPIIRIRKRIRMNIVVAVVNVNVAVNAVIMEENQVFQ